MKEYIYEERQIVSSDGSVVGVHRVPKQELIRCKDCKYWSAERINDFNKCRRWIHVGIKNFATMGEWFCGDGERDGGR